MPLITRKALKSFAKFILAALTFLVWLRKLAVWPVTVKFAGAAQPPALLRPRRRKKGNPAATVLRGLILGLYNKCWVIGQKELVTP